MDRNSLPLQQENKPVVVTENKVPVNTTTPETTTPQNTAGGDTSFQTDVSQVDATNKSESRNIGENIAMQQEVSSLNSDDADDIDGNLFFGTTNDELQTQDEYDDLTPEEQSEILNNLKSVL